MKVDLMRHIDFWLGVPLCFLLGAFDKIRSLFNLNKKSRSKKIKKVLHIKLSEIGAIILTYPLIKDIEKKHPDIKQYFLTFEKNKDIIGFFGGVIPKKNVFTIRDYSIFVLVIDTINVIKRIRKEKFDVTIDLEFFSRFTAILTYLSGARNRIGFHRYALEGLYRANLFTHRVMHNQLLHVSRLYLSISQVLEAENKKAPQMEHTILDEQIYLPKYVSDEKEKKLILKKLKEKGFSDKKRIVLVNPGEGTIPLREWPIENFISLTKKILDDENYVVVVIGTESYTEKDKEFCEKVDSERCINMTGETSMLELMELFSISEVLVINDCGLAHIASLTDLRQLVLFGPESPQIFAPLGKNAVTIYSNFPCSPCLSALNHRKSYCSDNKCLKQIKVQELYSIIKRSYEEKNWIHN